MPLIVMFEQVHHRCAEQHNRKGSPFPRPPAARADLVQGAEVSIAANGASKAVATLPLMHPLLRDRWEKSMSALPHSLPYWAVQPPSIEYEAPVMVAAASLARKTASAPMSSEQV
jgi:hypothetical protein